MNTKPWYQSKTIYALLALAALGLAARHGVEIPGITQQSIATALYDLLIGLFGALGIYGRATAAKPLAATGPDTGNATPVQLILLFLGCAIVAIGFGCAYNKYMQTANVYPSAVPPSQAAGAPGDLTATTTDKTAQALKGAVVVNLNMSGNPANTSRETPVDVMRGLGQGILQGAAVPVGQQPILTQNGTQQQFANASSPDATAKTDAKGVTQGNQQTPQTPSAGETPAATAAKAAAALATAKDTAATVSTDTPVAADAEKSNATGGIAIPGG